VAERLLAAAGNQCGEEERTVVHGKCSRLLNYNKLW
jgi:hypothetical protein